MNDALMEFLQRGQRVKERQLEVGRPNEQVDDRWAELKAGGIEKEQIVFVEEPNRTVQRHEIDVTNRVNSEELVEELHLVGMRLRMGMSHDFTDVRLARLFGQQ